MGDGDELADCRDRAWYSLADLLDDQGRSEAAVECLRKVLLVAPDYIDAIFNLACCCNEKVPMPRPQTIGGGIWQGIVRQDGQLEPDGR